MSSDPKPNVSQNQDPGFLQSEIERLLGSGLENFSVRELLGMMLSAVFQSERRAYLAQAWFWASKEHEIDLVDSERDFYEVKVGRTGLVDLSWFPKSFRRGSSSSSAGVSSVPLRSRA